MKTTINKTANAIEIKYGAGRASFIGGKG